jgi:hypothetical protein
MKFKLNQTKAREFARLMSEIDIFCREHRIIRSYNSSSYYFELNGKKYRVSNHSVEASNARAINQYGEQVRELYHPDGREKDVIYILASKTRIIEIYNNLEQGLTLDGRGNPIN